MTVGWPLGDYRLHLQAHWGAGTVGNRMHILRAFAREHPDPWAVTHRDIEARLRRCNRPEYAKSIRAALHRFYVWAIREGLTQIDPTAALEPIRIPVARARPAPPSVVELALMTSDDETRLMIQLMYDCGLRRFEVAQLHTNDVEAPWLWVVCGKGGKTDRVAMSRRVEDALGLAPHGWVFPSPVRAGQHVSADHVGRRVANALGGGWTAHNLRHACGTRLYQRTGDMYLSQQQLRHSSIATTQRYVLPLDGRLLDSVREPA